MDPQPLNYEPHDRIAARRRTVRRMAWGLLLALAALEFAGGILWCLAGAGIYGSPLAFGDGRRFGTAAAGHDARARDEEDAGETSA